MRHRYLLAWALALLLVPASGQAQQLFDFDGHAMVPDVEGNALTLHSIVLDGSPATTTPIPLDFANFEYTLVVSGLVLDADGSPQLYSGGTITIYEDDATAASFGDGSTFTDGTAILIGDVTTLSRSLPLIGTVGSANGNVDWTGGTRIDEIAPADRLSWSLLTGTNSDPSQTLSGYDEAWDGKVEPMETIVPTDEQSWSTLKSQY